MYQVLLPVDASEARATAQVAATTALPYADEEVAAVVLHVFDDEETAEKTTVEQTPAGKTMVEALREASVGVETQTTYGDPEERIVAVADEHDVDMIILGGRKRSPLGALVFGSVSQAVILDSERPVAITGSGAARE
ncbi:universal stress protein [Halomicroarcula sp. F13]|uniref:Universal stress protein n=1 Tax=Haloarcula rubra TaxID=2487747 RepID=A0AAW4PU32_9EURY|nr:universal stress protein [Halomicroarcula rubra]MBX0324649.1 universal stress protein [Halomicroarcula rubra]